MQLWDGRTGFSSHTVNYSLTGRRIDIQLKGTILPGHEQTWDRVLIAIEDVTERETARRHLSVAQRHLRARPVRVTVAIAPPSPSYTVAKILSRTRNVGCPQVSRSWAPGRPRAS